MTTANRTQSPCAAAPVTAAKRPAAPRQTAPGRHRRAAVVAVLAAVAALTVPHPASALVPIPPSPVRFPIADIGHTILTLAEQYTQAQPVEQRRLHNEMVLLTNTAHEAI
jgi:hypothetical protein